jgi:hypothetical protein
VLKVNQITIRSMAIEVASHLGEAFLTEHGSDGLLGLAFPQCVVITTLHWWQLAESLAYQG